MEHPEKVLFDEVLSLKKDIEESKERVANLKADYKEKIVLFGKRQGIKERNEEKLKKFKEKSKQTVTLEIDAKEYTFLKSTFENNIYKLNPRFLPTNQSHVFVDVQKSFFKLLMTIIIKGNEVYNVMKENPDSNINLKNNSKLIDKYSKEDKNLLSFLQDAFEADSFTNVVSHFNLNYEKLPKIDVKDLYVNYEIKSPYQCDNLKKYVADSAKSLGDLKDAKALFLGYNGHINIELAETARVRKIFVRPFCSDSSLWNPTSGASYTLIYCSMDGEDWEYMTSVPSNYGAYNTNNYITEITFNNYFSFRFIRFTTSNSSNFSINYLALKK